MSNGIPLLLAAKRRSQSPFSTLGARAHKGTKTLMHCILTRALVNRLIAVLAWSWSGFRNPGCRSPAHGAPHRPHTPRVQETLYTFT